MPILFKSENKISAKCNQNDNNCTVIDVHIGIYSGNDKIRARTQSEKRRCNMMSNSNSNRIVVPAAREAMDKFKMEAANEVGVNLKNGYNGDITSRQAGSVGGQMVKKMIEAYENGLK